MADAPPTPPPAAPAAPPAADAPPPASPAAPPPPAKAPPIGKPAEPLSYFDEIDQIAAGKPAKPAAPKEGAKPAPPTSGVSAGSTAATAGKGSAGKPGSTPAPTPDPGSTTPPSSAPPATLDAKALAKMPPQLREAYERTSAELKATKAELAAAKAVKPTEDPEKKVLVEQNQAHQKRITELEEQLKFNSFERTQEYEEQYNKPFVDAYNRGRRAAANLKVSNEEDGTFRQGSAEDFDSIMSIADDNEAADRAIELFGTKSAIVLAHRERVKEMNERRVQAIEDYRAKGQEREKQLTEKNATEKAEQQKRFEETIKSFHSLNSQAIEKYAADMKAEETDLEGAALLKREQALVDLAFKTITPEQIADLPDSVQKKLVNGQLPPEERVKLDSAIWAKARAYGFVKRKLTALQAELAEAKTALEEYQASAPTTGGGRRRDGSPRKQMTPEEEIDAIAAGNV